MKRTFSSFQKAVAATMLYALILPVASFAADGKSDKKQLTEDQKILHVMNRLGFGARLRAPSARALRCVKSARSLRGDAELRPTPARHGRRCRVRDRRSRDPRARSGCRDGWSAVRSRGGGARDRGPRIPRLRRRHTGSQMRSAVLLD